ncbi:MAG: hypothetical protein KG003_15115 [Bacteroidetes bacterium]|nr:hypothetical protein [Bacteroidota bacterium]
MEIKSKITLVLYPNTFGVGYVICENAQSIIDYGLKKVRPLTVQKYVDKIRWLYEFSKPDVVILRDYRNDDYKVSKRTQKVLNELQSLAGALNLNVYSYSRLQIKDVFSEFKASTKYEIAKQLTTWYPQLRSKMPSYRKSYMAESYHMGVFDAFALAIVHFYLTE